MLERSSNKEYLNAHHALDELRAVPADGLDGLEDVHLPVLNDLLDASVGCAVHAASTSPIPVQYRYTRFSIVKP